MLSAHMFLTLRCFYFVAAGMESASKGAARDGQAGGRSECVACPLPAGDRAGAVQYSAWPDTLRDKERKTRDDDPDTKDSQRQKKMQ